MALILRIKYNKDTSAYQLMETPPAHPKGNPAKTPPTSPIAPPVQPKALFTDSPIPPSGVAPANMDIVYVSPDEGPARKLERKNPPAPPMACRFKEFHPQDYYELTKKRQRTMATVTAKRDDDNSDGFFNPVSGDHIVVSNSRGILSQAISGMENFLIQRQVQSNREDYHRNVHVVHQHLARLLRGVCTKIQPKPELMDVVMGRSMSAQVKLFEKSDYPYTFGGQALYWLSGGIEEKIASCSLIDDKTVAALYLWGKAAEVDTEERRVIFYQDMHFRTAFRKMLKEWNVVTCCLAQMVHFMVVEALAFHYRMYCFNFNIWANAAMAPGDKREENLLKFARIMNINTTLNQTSAYLQNMLRSLVVFSNHCSKCSSDKPYRRITVEQQLEYLYKIGKYADIHVAVTDVLAEDTFNRV